MEAIYLVSKCTPFCFTLVLISCFFRQPLCKTACVCPVYPKIFVRAYHFYSLTKKWCLTMLLNVHSIHWKEQKLNLSGALIALLFYFSGNHLAFCFNDLSVYSQLYTYCALCFQLSSVVTYERHQLRGLAAPKTCATFYQTGKVTIPSMNAINLLLRTN